MPGDDLTHGPPANRKQAAATTGSAGSRPAFPAQWFYGLSRAPRCTGLCSHRRSQIIACELDPSVGGPHGFAVRIDSARQARQHVHHIPAHVS